jgi:hypothetical protein
LEVSLREVEAGGQELKRAMKEATDSGYAVYQKLAYEKRARRDLEVEFEVVLKSLLKAMSLAMILAMSSRTVYQNPL